VNKPSLSGQIRDGRNRWEVHGELGLELMQPNLLQPLLKLPNCTVYRGDSGFNFHGQSTAGDCEPAFYSIGGILLHLAASVGPHEPPLFISLLLFLLMLVMLASSGRSIAISSVACHATTAAIRTVIHHILEICTAKGAVAVRCVPDPLEQTGLVEDVPARRLAPFVVLITG